MEDRATATGEMGSGRMQYSVYFVDTFNQSINQECTFEVREDEMQSIRMALSEGSIEVDLPTGRITVDANVRPLAEYMTLAFAVGIIFVNMRKHPFTPPVDGSHATGSVRSTVSTRAALRGHSSGRTSPTLSDTPSRRSAASRLVARSQVTNAMKKINKRHRMSASFTFLIACGLQVDDVLHGVNGGDSIGRASHTTGRHGNSNAPANGNANYKTSSSPVTARRNQLQQQRQQQQPRNDDHRHFIDIRL